MDGNKSLVFNLLSKKVAQEVEGVRKGKSEFLSMAFELGDAVW